MATKKEMLNKKLKSIFSDRYNEREIFLNLVESKTMDFSILNIKGIGGIGKTMLVEEYQRLCIERKTPISVVDVGFHKSVIEKSYFKIFRNR